jgi:hypothetical protein
MMDWNGTTTTTLYCTRCDWQKIDAGPACANVCPYCQEYGLRWVRFVPGAEDAAAASVINDARHNNPTNEPHFSGVWCPERSRVPHRPCPGDR